MNRVAVILADGFEEIEALTVVDVMRRAGETCHMISIKNLSVIGGHNIIVQADAIIDDKIKDYDLLVFPGGMPGSTNLQTNSKVVELVKYFNDNNKLIGAICAAPIVLAEANIIEGRDITSYPGYEEDLKGSNYHENKLVIIDKNIVTSRGPATALEFSYQLLEKLGNPAYTQLKDAMMYDFLMKS